MMKNKKMSLLSLLVVLVVLFSFGWNSVLADGHSPAKISTDVSELYTITQYENGITEIALNEPMKNESTSIPSVESDVPESNINSASLETNENSSASIASSIDVIIDAILNYDLSTKTIWNKSVILSVTGAPELWSVTSTANLEKASSRMGPYVVKATGTKSSLRVGGYVETSKTQLGTGFWRVKVDSVCSYGVGSGSPGQYSVSSYSNALCLNNVGQVYPSTSDAFGKLVLPEPNTTWAWVPVANRVPALTNTQRDNYKIWYQNTYNNGNPLNWTNVEIHHICPRAYGGTNDYSNLIPLDSTTHRSVVSPWWVNYGTYDPTSDED